MLDSSSTLAFIVASFAVWRLTHLLVNEAGPGNAFGRLRDVRGLQAVLGCFYCCSLWTALPPALWLGSSAVEWLAWWLGLSGSAILIERLGAGRSPPPALWQEDEGVAPVAPPSPPNPHPASPPKEDSHVLLRP